MSDSASPRNEDEQEVTKSQVWAAAIVDIALNSNKPIGCSDCRNALDVSDCETEDEVIEVMENHRRQYHA